MAANDILLSDIITKLVPYSIPKGKYFGIHGAGASGFYLLFRSGMPFSAPDGTPTYYIYYWDTNSTPPVSAKSGYSTFNTSDRKILNIENMPKFDYASYSYTNMPTPLSNGTRNDTSYGFPFTLNIHYPDEVSGTEINNMINDLRETIRSSDPAAWKEHIQVTPQRIITNPIYLNDLMEHVDPYYKDEPHELNY